MVGELGPWEPLPLVDATSLFQGAPFRWWVCGGHALELHLGRSWRTHDDIDIGICLDDARALRSWLSPSPYPSPEDFNKSGIPNLCDKPPTTDDRRWAVTVNPIQAASARRQ